MIRFVPCSPDELLTSGAKIEKLIVAHPALARPTEIQILYLAYEGWIYSGRSASRTAACNQHQLTSLLSALKSNDRKQTAALTMH